MTLRKCFNPFGGVNATLNFAQFLSTWGRKNKLVCALQLFTPYAFEKLSCGIKVGRRAQKIIKRRNVVQTISFGLRPNH